MGSNVIVLNRAASSDFDVWSRSGYGRWNREGNFPRPHWPTRLGTSAVQL